MGTQRLIPLGRIVGVHGIRGDVKIHSDCRPPAALFEYRHWVGARKNGETIPLELTQGREQGRGLVAHFRGIEDRNAAEALRGVQLLIARDQLPTLREGQFYWADLEGLRVLDENDRELGEVTSIFETGANDVLVVREASGRELLIPLVIPEVVYEVNLEACTMRVHWAPEWLEE